MRPTGQSCGSKGAGGGSEQSAIITKKRRPKNLRLPGASTTPKEERTPQETRFPTQESKVALPLVPVRAYSPESKRSHSTYASPGHWIKRDVMPRATPANTRSTRTPRDYESNHTGQETQSDVD